MEAAYREAEDRQADEQEPRQLTLAGHKALFALERLKESSLNVQRRLKPPNKKDSSVLVASQIRFSKGKQKLISQTRSRGPDDARAISRVTLAHARQIRGRRLRRDVVRAAR